MSFLIFALSAPSVVLGQYFSQPNYGYENPMIPSYQNPMVQIGVAGPQAPQEDSEILLEAYVDPSKIKEMTEDNVRKIEAAIGKQREKAKIAANEQKEDIQSLVEHDIKIKSDRIDADLAQHMRELHEATNAKKAALRQKGDQTLQLQFAEVDRNLEQTFAEFQDGGQRQIYEALEAQSSLTKTMQNMEEKKKEGRRKTEEECRGAICKGER